MGKLLHALAERFTRRGGRFWPNKRYIGAMGKFLHALAEHLPHRRRRLWRYVSPHRRGAGVVVLAVLLTAGAGYWHLTNGRRIRRQAERYLRDLTGCYVSIRDAKFRLFGRIELDGVSIDLDVDGQRKRFFWAQTVVLRHRPAGLLGGRLEPTEVLCMSPAVTLLHSGQGAEGLFSWALYLKGAESAWRGRLPAIRVRGGQLSFVDAETGVQMFLARDVDVTMTPLPDRSYQVAFDGRSSQDDEEIWGRFDVNLATGQVDFKEGSVPIQSLDEALPRKYRAWRQRYQVTGTLIPKAPRDGAPAAQERLKFELMNVSLRLPPEEGGLDLEHVRGAIAFDADGVTLERVTGQIVQADRARFTVTGRYGGYQVDSPFEIEAQVQGVPLGRPELAQALGGRFEHIDRAFSPTGRVDLAAKLRRGPDGRVAVHGQAELLGVTVRPKGFPYKLENITGTIDLEPGRAELRGVLAEHGPARLRAEGFLTGLGKGSSHDLLFTILDGHEMPLDAELAQALPAGIARVWRAVRPSGSAGGNVRLSRQPEDQRGAIEVAMELGGKASMSYAGFPYPLRNLYGRINVAGSRVAIEALRGGEGKMRCRINGYLADLETERQAVDLLIKAWDVPLDEVFSAALARRNRQAAEAIRHSGVAETVEAKITQAPGEPIDYDIAATFNGAQFEVRDFPYLVSDAAGRIVVRRDYVRIMELVGRHGSSPVTLNGRLWPGGEQMGMNLEVTARDLLLDDDLFRALPAGFKQLWGTVGLAGRVDAQLWFRRDAPGGEAGVDYALKIDAKDLYLEYKDFPYALTGLVGQVAVAPGRIEVGRLVASSGPTRIAISGSVFQDGPNVRADLSVQAEAVPVDRKLLDALPAEFAPLVERISAGGTCDVDLDRLRLLRRDEQAASNPATQPAGSNSSATVDWDLEGALAWQDVVLDLGFGPKVLTGRIHGTGGRTGRKLKLQADVDLASVQVGKRRITDLSGRVVKDVDSQTIHIKDMFGRAHGGRMAGFAEIRLTDPLEYRMSLDVEGIRLEELIVGQAEAGAAPSEPDIKGLLDGRLEMTTRTGTGRDADRQGSGILRISKASLKKFPVVLGLLHVVTIALPAESSLSDGWIEYRVDGDTLILDEIHFNGPSVGLMGPSFSLIGSGTVDLKTERLALNFLSDPAGQLPRLKSLDELLSGFVRELVEIQVTGTLSRPNTRTVPLRSIEAAVRRLVSPGREAGQPVLSR